MCHRTALTPVPLGLLDVLASHASLSLLFPLLIAPSRHSEAGTMIHLHNPPVSPLHHSKSITTATIGHS
jgi:hypothetical protein